MKKILLAEPRGFCAGVLRAVGTVSKAVELRKNVTVINEIVHNKLVLEKFKKQGVKFSDHKDVKLKNETVIFPAHGTSPKVKEKFSNAIDATCPLVQNVHNQIRNWTKKGFHIYLIGDSSHDEIIAAKAISPKNITIVPVGNVKNIKIYEKSLWLSQTTLNLDDVLKTVDELKKRVPSLIGPKVGSICYATKNRQLAVKRIAKMSDFVIVLGSKNSSNSTKLYKIANDITDAILVDTYKELANIDFGKIRTIGITSGASVPEVLVEEVVNFLKEKEFVDIEVISTVKEDIKFPLPKI